MNPMAGDSVESLLADCAREYEAVVKNVDAQGKATEGRAYGGVVRGVKGKLVEDIARKLVHAAWIKNGRAGELECKIGKFDIPIQRGYVDALEDESLKREILAHIDDYKIRHGTDIHVYIDGNFVLSVECKAYAENAMMKRILFDARLLRERFPRLRFVLVQLESQLGGDYSDPVRSVFGSRQTHTLMSYMTGTQLSIATLLEGERKVEFPIHRFYKPLKRENLLRAVDTIAGLLIRENAVD